MRMIFDFLGTSKFLIVPSGLGNLWMSWDDLLFGSPLIWQPYAQSWPY